MTEGLMFVGTGTLALIAPIRAGAAHVLARNTQRADTLRH